MFDVDFGGREVFTIGRIFIGIIKFFIKLILFFGLEFPLAFVGGFLWLVLVKYPEVLEEHETLLMFPFFFGLTISILLSLAFTVRNFVRLFKKDPTITLRSMFGVKSAKKITDPTIKEIRSDSGFIFGKWKGKYIAKSEKEDGHILVIGGAGSGKSSCLAIPTLDSWLERVFAIDIKGELLAKCTRDRNRVKVFAPQDIASHGYDPFWALHESENVAQDIKDITLAIMPTPPDVKDPFWIESAQNVLNGSLSHFYGLGYTFIESMQKIASTPVKTLLNEIMSGNNTLAKIFVAQLIDQKDETLAGIATELSNKIMLFATDPMIVSALSRDVSVTPKDLENGFDVFIQIPEDKLEQWKSLLTLINNQFLKYFEKRSETDSKPILFLLDEFARLGKIEAILNGLATLRSKKITIAILTQSLAQLDLIYGKESRQVIADNCSYKAILKATDADTQEYFSKLVGTYDKMKKTSSANFEQYTQMGKGTGASKTTEEKRIIKPEEFATLDKIVLLTPFGFCRAEKTPYYKDKRFLKGANQNG